jgi:hypothetical protein
LLQVSNNNDIAIATQYRLTSKHGHLFNASDHTAFNKYNACTFYVPRKQFRLI